MKSSATSLSEYISNNAMPEADNPPLFDLGVTSKRAKDALSRWFFLARMALTTALLLSTVILSVHKEIGQFSVELSMLFLLLLASYIVGLSTAAGLRLKASVNLLVTVQVTWDLIFTILWVYWTGGTGSLFLFLYLFIIIEASILLDSYSSALITFLCGLSYWVELHLEYHKLLFPKTIPVSAPVITHPADYPISTLTFILAVMISAVWLTIILKQRLSTTDILLREKSDSIQNLLQLNESIVRCIRSGLISLDLNQRITSINKAAMTITQTNLEDLLGQNIEQFLGPIPLKELTEQEASSEVPLRWEQIFVRKDNTRLTLGCSGAVLQDPYDQYLGHLIVFQDLTYYKQIEDDLKRTEKLAAIGGMAAGLAHEIRNPLASLYGSIQLLQGQLTLHGSQERLMNIILKESERLNGLITDFLQFASPNTGQREEVDLRNLVEETLELFKRGPHYKEGIKIELDIPPLLQLYVNSRQIHQMLWNLLLNAVQAISETGSIVISGREEQSREGYPFVFLSIEDSGKGIPVEKQSKIFDPFYTNREAGTGLGLSIVHRIIENHEGKIRVMSREGKGTSFQIELPFFNEDRSKVIHEEKSKSFISEVPSPITGSELGCIK